MVDHRILIKQEELRDIIERLAEAVSAFYSGKHITALVLLEGAKYFAQDLLAEIDVPFDVEFLKVSSYRGTVSGGTVSLDADETIAQRLRDKHVLIIDDIFDSGRTLYHLLNWIEDSRPASVKTCVLLEKEIARDAEVRIDFSGLTVPDVFVIGYGMDFDGQYRELPFVAELASECIKE